MRRVTEWKRSVTVCACWRAVAFGAAVFVFALILQPRADAKERESLPKDAHGAVDVGKQQERLAELQAKQEIGAAPDGIDPVVWEIFVPKDNATTSDRVALGRKLYFDKRLSKDGTVSCATCHDVFRGFTDQRKVSEGIGGKLGQRNAPTSLNGALLQSLFLDGRSPTLDHQARLPIVNPIEMGMESGEEAVKAIAADPEYLAAFRKAYGREVNYEDIGRAIGAFERTLVFVDSPFRRFVKGDSSALSEEAAEGWVLYNGKARCASCHPMSPSNPLGTDNRFHNVGVSARNRDFQALAKKALQALAEDPSEKQLDELALQTEMGELGRFMVTKQTADMGAFRTPMILNTGITPPYMHDGSLETLWDVLDHYNKGGEANLFLDGAIEPLALTEQEIDELVALLFSMTDDRFAEENRSQMKRQKEAAAKARPFRDDDAALRRKIAFTRPATGEVGEETTP